MIASKHPAPRGYIDALWRASRPGAGENQLSWPEVQYLQNRATGVWCGVHDLPGLIVDEQDTPRCVACIEEAHVNA